MSATLSGLSARLANRATSRQQLISRIRERAERLETLSDNDLMASSMTLINELQAPCQIDEPDIQVEAAAHVTESIRRREGIRLHDVQLLGGLVIASGEIAEMQTGEGKTFVAIVGAYLQAIAGRGVHVSTTNAYLARRDFETAERLLAPLGISVGFLPEDAGLAATRAAYDCDVTYGTGYQFGFDYLRDQIARRERSERCLGHRVIQAIHGVDDSTAYLRQRRPFAMAIVDEADSVMIDEAMVPLIISGASAEEESDEAYLLSNELAADLIEQEDYEIDPQSQAICLTVKGNAKIHAGWQHRAMPSLVRPWAKYVENAIRANLHLQRDQHYVVRDGEVQIVDQNTGRIFSDRTWRDGLHQAVEAKEGLKVRATEQSTSRITRQRFFGFYERVAGLTGTIAESADEIKYFYDLKVTTIPTNVPCRRFQLPSRFFARLDAKRAAIAESAARLHHKLQPVLIGTTTIEESRKISELLAARQVSHLVLNGVQDEDEADIISRAGRVGSVLVATNMAGRGTDIKPCKDAKARGGLHVIAAQHAPSARIDRQLVGRSARQGDPGSCQYFVSAEDELIAKNDPGLANRIVSAADASGECRQDFAADISKLQNKLEAAYFRRRKLSVQSDLWFDQVREALH